MHKTIIVIVLLLCNYAAQGQKLKLPTKMPSFGPKTLTYSGSYTEGMNLNNFLDEDHAAVLIIQNEIYVPDNRCLCERFTGEDSLGRNAGDDDSGRNAGDDDSGRNAGDDDSGRNAGDDDSGRNAGDDNSGRDSGTDSVSRADLEDTVNRENDSDDTGRNSGDDDTGRNSGDDDTGRNSGNDDSGRNTGNDDSGRSAGGDSQDRKRGSEVTKIKCNRVKDSCGMEVEGIHPNAKILIFDGSTLTEVQKEMIDEGLLLNL